MSMSASGQLAEKYGIDIKPGRKGNCPFCGHATFSIKPDDTIGKCFHPTCGRFVTPGVHGATLENGLHRVLEEIFQDFHASLLELGGTNHPNNAYSYLVHQRGIHHRVVSDSMLGAVPLGYNWASKFDSVIKSAEAAVRVEKNDDGRHATDCVYSAEHNLEFLVEARDKFRTCTQGNAGWVAFFYTDASHRIVGIRFREPYCKHIVYFKPYKTVAGLFGHGLFTPYRSEGGKSLNDFLLVTEGEFNQLQLQSLSLRYGEVTGQDTGYLFACSVGGVNNADYEVIRRTSRRPIFCYDNDSDDAGLTLVNKARETMSVCAFTTPSPASDMDDFIRSFEDDYRVAWEAVKALVAGRKSFPRIYSGTGMEFYRRKTFIPKLLADAIMEQQHFRYTASVLWVYTNGVYRPNGESQVKIEAQALLGEERRENRIIETLRYIEIAANVTPPDPNPVHINLTNGRLDWKREKLEPHSPDIFEIVQLPVKYDPNARCPRFDRYLETTLEPRIIPLVDEIIGYCLIPDTRFEKAVMCVGNGGNGKSVLLDTIITLLGSENVSTVSLQDLSENHFRVAELHGKLTNIFADLDDRALNSSSVFKTLVTGDRITAERKFAQPFSFRPYARLIFSANSLIPSRDRTDAFYRRWLIIPFERSFKGETADKDLKAKLREELSGILNRALSGLRRLFSNGRFSEPPAVKVAIEEYRRENDTVASFVVDRVVDDPDGTIEKKILYSKYRFWCEGEGVRPVTQKQIKASLKHIFPKLGEVRPSRGTGPWHWVGVRFIEDTRRPTDGCNG
jgi:P4 family phage/plasmid primase-like protien